MQLIATVINIHGYVPKNRETVEMFPYASKKKKTGRYLPANVKGSGQAADIILIVSDYVEAVVLTSRVNK